MEHEIIMNNDIKKTTSYSSHYKGWTLITGATGLIGSHIAENLLRKGHRIIVLIRSKGNYSAFERFNSLCDFLRINSLVNSNVRILEGSLDKFCFGLEKSIYKEIIKQTDRIIHCAGNTSFSEWKRTVSERDNITGLKNLLEFCRQSRCSWFHLISTVYTAGIKNGICEEKIYKQKNFTNIYEETKYRCESMTSEFCNDNNIKTTILRPSIVVGDSQTGRTFRFNGLYYPLKALILIRDMFRDNLNTGQDKYTQQMSISYENGKVNMPLRFEHKTREGINFVPIDFVVNAIQSIIEKPINGGIYHIAARNYVTITELIEFTHKFFNITGLSTVSPGFFSYNRKTSLECLFDQYIDPYLPYIKDRRKFSTKNTDSVLNPLGITCPKFDYTIFSRCMEYALKTKWGKVL